MLATELRASGQSVVSLPRSAGRQPDRESRSGPRLAGNVDAAAVCFNETVRYRQTEPATAAWLP